MKISIVSSVFIFAVSVAVLSSPAYAERPATFADMWAGRASFIQDGDSFGKSFGMHFLSTQWYNNQLYTYYIFPEGKYIPPGGTDDDGVPLQSIGFALSPNGTTFTDMGKVVPRGGEGDYVFNVGTSFRHKVGRSDASCGGWSASTTSDPSGFLAYGPYVSGVRTGTLTAQFLLKIDSLTGLPDDIIATVDVYDSVNSPSKALSQKVVRRRDFSPNTKEAFIELVFSNPSKSLLELRTYYQDKSYLCLKSANISIGQRPFLDNAYTSFPSVHQDYTGWYIVYEGQDINRSSGDVRLATSADGYSWARYQSPILTKSQQWETGNVGTPNLWKVGDTWYLFYHGFDIVKGKVQVGLATGTDLFHLTRRNSGNPILTNGTTWDSGTVGKRSIVKQGAFYYMVYEGSTDGPDWGKANWSSGVARSLDLVTWEKYPNNPVLPVSVGSMGYDGPDIVITPDKLTHIYYRHPAAKDGLLCTDRRTLMFKTSGLINHSYRNMQGGAKSDLVNWRSSNGYWYLKTAESNFQTFSQSQFGLPGDVPISSDLDGDGLDEKIVWRPSNGTWYYKLTSDASGRVVSTQWGLSGDTPVVGDIDGDGFQNLAVWRGGQWFILIEPAGGAGGPAGYKQVSFGTAGQIPVPGDYDGDGKTNLATWDPSSAIWYIRTSTGGVQTIQWGLSGDVPVPADYDGNGRFEVAVWRPSEGNWYVRDTVTGNYTITQWGLPGDIPVLGDFNGDNILDKAVWRPNAGANWYIRYSNGTASNVIQLGLQSDKVPTAY